MIFIKLQNRSCFFIVLALILGYQSFSQSFIKVKGRHILGPCGDTILLRGINYAPYNWGWSPNQLRIKELAKTKANCVRLVWYKTGQSGTPASTYSNLDLLDSSLSQSIKHGLIPILVLHDQTCQNSPSDLIDLANWFVRSAVLQIISKYKHSLILNIANEVLHVNWAGNPVTAKVTFLNTYTTIVNTLRNVGIEVPLMIDGPDCGTNLDVLASVGPALVAEDQAHNLIFSAHAYWYSFAGNDSSQMEAKINNALSVNMAFVFGELANFQDDASLCQYVLNYQPLLKICKRKKIGWMAWSWDNDGCVSRQISLAGSFSNLSPYGQVIVNDLEFGLSKDTVPGSQFLKLAGCLTSTKPDASNEFNYTISPNPSRGKIKIFHNKEIKNIEVISFLGEVVQHLPAKKIDLENPEIEIGSHPGFYWLRVDYKHYFKIVNLGY